MTVTFEETSLASRLEDTRCALGELKRHLPQNSPLTLAGLRLGASIAALAAAGRSDVARLLLWDPVTDGAEYMQAVLRSNLMLQMAQHRRVMENRELLVERLDRGELVNVEGYMLNGELYREVSAIQLAAARPEATVRSLIVSIVTGDSPAREQHVDLGKAWPNSTVATAVEEPFWREIRRFYGRAHEPVRPVRRLARRHSMSNPCCITIPNQQGHMLHGILHTPPPATARGVCVLLLSPGIKGRIGPHRLYLKLAAQLVPAGFHVLRFDFHGLGDSEGELHEELLADVYNTIQGGRYVEDTIAAMNWMEAEHGIAQFIGSGLCGGSITALLSAARDLSHQVAARDRLARRTRRRRGEQGPFSFHAADCLGTERILQASGAPLDLVQVSERSLELSRDLARVLAGLRDLKAGPHRYRRRQRERSRRRHESAVCARIP